MDANREKAIDLAVSQIERQFGKGAIMKLGEAWVPKDMPAISTGFCSPLTFFITVRRLAISPKPSGPSSRWVISTWAWWFR